MANGFSNLLGRIARPFYPGRDLDEEERRRIEELRAQGVYVPQERRITPFGYGSGRQRRENLTAIRAAIQPEQKRRLDEYLARAGEQERRRAAQEEQNLAVRLATENEERRAGLQRRKEERDQASKDYKQRVAGDPMLADFDEHIGKDWYMQNIAEPALTNREQAELTVRQRGLLPVRKEEAAVETAELDLQDKKETSDLAQRLRDALPSNYPEAMAQGTMLDAQLKNILAQSKIEFEQSGKAQQLRDQKWSEDMIKGAAELQQLRAFDAWLKTSEGQQFMLDGGIQGFNLKTAENETRAKLIAAARTSGVDLSGVLGPEFYNRSGGPGNVPTSRTAVGSAPLDVLSGGQVVRPSVVDERRTPAPSRPRSMPRGRTGGAAPAGAPAPATQTPAPARVSPTLSPASRQQIKPTRDPALSQQLNPSVSPSSGIAFPPRWRDPGGETSVYPFSNRKLEQLSDLELRVKAAQGNEWERKEALRILQERRNRQP